MEATKKYSMSKAAWNKGLNLKDILSPKEYEQVVAYKKKCQKKVYQKWRAKNKASISEKARIYYRKHHPKVKFLTNTMIFREVAESQLDDFLVDEFEEKNPALYTVILECIRRGRYEGLKKASNLMRAESVVKRLRQVEESLAN